MNFVTTSSNESWEENWNKRPPVSVATFKVSPRWPLKIFVTVYKIHNSA